jgi:hypothetical protein
MPRHHPKRTWWPSPAYRAIPMPARLASTAGRSSELVGRTDVEVALGREVPLVRPLATTRRRTVRRASGMPSCRRRRPLSSATPLTSSWPKPAAVGRDHPGHPGAAHQSGARGQSSRDCRGCSRLHADGWRVRRLRQRHQPPSGTSTAIPTRRRSCSAPGRARSPTTRRSRGRSPSGST